MIFALERVTQPAIEPVTLAEMRAHLREFSTVTEHDTEITNLIKGAREWVESFTGRALIDQTWRLSVLPDTVARDDFSNRAWWFWTGAYTPAQGILLRRSPVLELVSAATVDTDGVQSVIDVDDLAVREADSKWPRLFGITEANPVIEFRAGFADRSESPPEGADKVPETFKSAIRLHVEAMYNRDKDMMEKLLLAAQNVARPERAELMVA